MKFEVINSSGEDVTESLDLVMSFDGDIFERNYGYDGLFLKKIDMQSHTVRFPEHEELKDRVFDPTIDELKAKLEKWEKFYAALPDSYQVVKLRQDYTIKHILQVEEKADIARECGLEVE
jgi:hypothetical protein